MKPAVQYVRLVCPCCRVVRTCIRVDTPSWTKVVCRKCRKVWQAEE